MTRILRIGAVMLIGVLLLCGATIVGLQLAISRGVLTPQLDSALERATGRRITYRAISMGLGLWPRIELVDTTIANFPGGSHAEFARIGRFEVTLALLPLVVGRVEIDGLTIADAEITLERNALGQGNWVFGAGGGESSGTLTIEWVEIENSRIRMAAGPITDIRIDTLSITRDAPEDPVELDGRIRLDGEAVAFTVKLGRETDGVLPFEAAI